MEDKPIQNFMESDTYKAYKAFLEEKEKHRKRGSNVIHVEYLGDILSEADFKEYDERLEEVGLQLSRYDKNGVMYASLDKYELLTYISIAQPILIELLKGVGTNATWDAIKHLTKTISKKVAGLSYIKRTTTHTDKKKITFGIKVQLDRNTGFNFNIDGDLDEKVIEQSLDKVLSFIGEQQLNSEYKQPDYVYFDNTSGSWVKVDVQAELLRMAQNGELDRK